MYFCVSIKSGFEMKMADLGTLFRELYRVSNGPRHEFWHPDFLASKYTNDYEHFIFMACRTWEKETCESIMKGLRKTPFIWALRNQTRKWICEHLSSDEKKVMETVPLPHLDGICPPNVEFYELTNLFRSMLPIIEMVFGRFAFSEKENAQFEKDVVSNLHWFFPHSTLGILVFNHVRCEARKKFQVLTGEDYGNVLLPVLNEWSPLEKKRKFESWSPCEKKRK